MFLVIACATVIAVAYRFRRDVTGPELTLLSRAVSWVSLGALLLWVGLDWITGETDQWFTTLTGALPLAVIEVACLVLMTFDTLRERRRSVARRRKRTRHTP